MAVKLVFMGRLEDVAGAAERLLELGEATGLADLLAQLPVPLALAVAEPRIRLALNGALVGDPAAIVLRDGDELAFLPPVSGG